MDGNDYAQQHHNMTPTERLHSMLQSSVMRSGMINLILISTGLGHLMLDDTSAVSFFTGGTDMFVELNSLYFFFHIVVTCATDFFVTPISYKCAPFLGTIQSIIILVFALLGSIKPLHGYLRIMPLSRSDIFPSQQNGTHIAMDIMADICDGDRCSLPLESPHPGSFYINLTLVMHISVIAETV